MWLAVWTLRLGNPQCVFFLPDALPARWMYTLLGSALQHLCTPGFLHTYCNIPCKTIRCVGWRKVLEHKSLYRVVGIVFNAASYNTGVSSFGYGEISRTFLENTITFAHEIGHNWGAGHDQPLLCGEEWVMSPSDTNNLVSVATCTHLVMYLLLVCKHLFCT